LSRQLSAKASAFPRCSPGTANRPGCTGASSAPVFCAGAVPFVRRIPFIVFANWVARWRFQATWKEAVHGILFSGESLKRRVQSYEHHLKQHAR
jgi:hypothetical protein